MSGMISILELGKTISSLKAAGQAVTALQSLQALMTAAKATSVSATLTALVNQGTVTLPASASDLKAQGFYIENGVLKCKSEATTSEAIKLAALKEWAAIEASSKPKALGTLIEDEVAGLGSKAAADAKKPDEE